MSLTLHEAHIHPSFSRSSQRAGNGQGRAPKLSFLVTIKESRSKFWGAANLLTARLGGAIVSSSSHTAPPSDPALRVKAIESLLIEKGIVDPLAIGEVIEIYEHRVVNGAKVVARAWTDQAYKARLLAEGTTAIAEFGFSGAQGEDMVVLENTPAIHNVVVCTLCSCYPWPVLGLPPVWYKAAAYRSRIVLEPRAVLAELGVVIAPDVEVRVWDFNRRTPIPRPADAPARH